jgi:hypothetical protein
MLTNSNGTNTSAPLVEALHADGPVGEELRLFGRFVGRWDLRWTGQDADGSPAEAEGELTFGWVLGGRAAQDVWVVPRPGSGPTGARPRFHGTTVRFHDADLGAWRSTWIEPVNGRVRTFIGRPDGDDIELVSLDGEPLLRWRFTQITADSFTWLGELSVDEGRTWQLEERMDARRRA